MDKGRRKTLAMGVGLGAAGVAGFAAFGRDGAEPKRGAEAHGGAGREVGSSGQAASGGDRVNDGSSLDGRLPVVYLPHGGGPWPFVDVGFGDAGEYEVLESYLRQLHTLPKSPVKALLVISAHWEEAQPTVMSGAEPPMLYDYYGFPKESYEIEWPAPGDPALAARVQQLLSAAGFQTASDDKRGFDHGTFVPLKLTYPEADVPTVQLSLKRGLRPAEHVAIGRALAPLRDEGVFIIGSGMSYHNMRGFGPQGLADSVAFDEWLQSTAVLPEQERNARLSKWEQAPSARAAHPREEHLLPMMVIAGAAGQDVGSVGFAGRVLGVRVSAYHFG